MKVTFYKTVQLLPNVLWTQEKEMLIMLPFYGTFSLGL